MEKLTAISTTIIAIATVLGVGGGIATYFTEFLRVSYGLLGIILLVYILVILLSILALKLGFENEI